MTTSPTYITGTIQAQAYRVLREHVYSVLQRYDLTPTYWSMLGIITQARDGVRQVDIANGLKVKAPLVTGMAQELSARGLIQSARNQFDGRAKLLALTPAGRKLVKAVEQELDGHLRQLLTGITDEEILTYHKVLQAIVSNDIIVK
ncbi:MAG TPA: MarR family transcriptional regulator [Candidatus Saccharimonadales bacterium]|nr:MarR family transcriptional regulator [Candidatus Saccharimonadales bacterium]